MLDAMSAQSNALSQWTGEMQEEERSIIDFRLEPKINENLEERGRVLVAEGLCAMQ